MIWKHKPTLEQVNAVGENTMVSHLGIVMTEVGDDYLKATMPVDHRTVQPMRLLHGGASVALAETLGSTASAFCVENPGMQGVVGVEINANHLSSGQEGEIVTGVARPIKIGRTLQVWEIKITNPQKKLLCVSRITIAVISKR